MHPRAVMPKKIGVQGPSSKREVVVQRFNNEEKAELNKLKSLLPQNKKNKTDPTEVVLSAANYIEQLVATVRARVQCGTLPIEALNSLPPAFQQVAASRPSRSRTQKKRRSMEKKR